MKNKPYTSFNLYFFIPFILWMIVGGIVLQCYTKEQLFRFFNTNTTSFADAVMPSVTSLGEGWFIAIVLLLLFGFSMYRNWWYFITALAATTIPTLVTQLLKSSYMSPRPLKYFSGDAWIHTLPEWPQLMERSFPSGHSCGAFSLYCLLAMLLTPKYKALGMFFFVLGLVTAYSRMYLAAHFFEDVYAGSIIGVCFVALIVTIMNRVKHLFFKQNKV